MGRGIAQVALASGHPVHLVDPDEAQLKAAESDVTARLSRKDPAASALVKARLHTSPTSPTHRRTPPRWSSRPSSSALTSSRRFCGAPQNTSDLVPPTMRS
ncbi:3-hydroxyacyl-CoA dehydrogenase NAD-binding domain-containing protein [Streptomyces sp. NBC_00481]|uniref:3-hydroxyacyl-CoA dehydrogenase NAD-binding domain-containing protein n=1 Tax=unclassified Streptomyces TaxID=2593676 RepID=UPI003FA3706C